MNEARKSSRLAGLDGLRALSVAGVIFAHISSDDRLAVGHTLKALGNRGNFGVHVFFVLSGFLITWLLLKEETSTGRISLKNFYFRRAFRILPPALAYLAVIAVLSALGLAVAGALDITSAALFFRNYISSPAPECAHYWSLSVEEQFYVFWPLSLILCPKRWRIPLSLALFVASGVWYGYVHRQADVNVWRFDLICGGLLAGSSLALLRNEPRILQILRGRGAQSYWTLAGIFLVLGAALSPQAQQGSPMIRGLAVTASTAAIAGLINWVIQDKGTFLDRFLNLAPMVWLGQLSYSLYLWQQLFCYNTHVDTFLTKFPQNILFSIAAASASFYLIERPILRWRDRRSTLLRSKEAEAAPAEPAPYYSTAAPLVRSGDSE